MRIDPGISDERLIDSTKDWSLPDQLAYSSVSVLWKIAAGHPDYKGVVLSRHSRVHVHHRHRRNEIKARIRD